MKPKYHNPDLDEFLAYLEREDKREAKHRAAIEQQRQRDRAEVSGKQLAWLFGLIVAAAVLLGWWAWYVLGIGER
jgi:hypothetical protein